MSVLEVPVLDISALMAARDDAEVRATLTEDNPTLQHTIAELRVVAAEWGFFYVSNHGVSEQQLDAFRSAMRAFFAQPQSAKDAVRRSKSNSRGYFDNELTKNKTDWKEGFDFAQDGEAAHVCTDDSWFGEVKNQWPSEENLPGFQKTMVEYYITVEHIARRLIQVFAVALGEDVDFFDQFFYKQLKGGVRARGNTNLVRLNHYPPAPEPEKTMGVYNHTDPGAVTVLLQDDIITSLQVFHRGTKQWFSVPPKPNTFVINIGDMIQVWSNDRFVAPEHRVLANKDANRYSAPLFFNPSLEAEVQPIIMDEGEKPHYRSVNWLNYILERAKGNYDDLGEEIQIDRFRITP